jgi:hypothetical protein
VGKFGVLRRVRRSFALAPVAVLALIPAFMGIAEASPVRGQVQPVTANAFDTYAGMSCIWVQGLPVLSYTATGLGFSPNQQVDVYLDIRPPEALAKSGVKPMDSSTTVWTDSTGFWSVPTYSEWPGGGGGPWTLVVDVYRHNSGKLSSGWDQCSF